MKIEGVLVQATTTHFTPTNRDESQVAVMPEKQHYQTEQKQISVEELQKKVDGLNKFLKSSNTNLKFNLHEELNEYYVTIIDQATDEVIKEIPPKKLLDIYAAMKKALGLFIDKKI